MLQNKRFVGTSVQDIEAQFDKFFGDKSKSNRDILLTQFGWDGTDLILNCEYDDTIFHG